MPAQDRAARTRHPPRWAEPCPKTRTFEALAAGYERSALQAILYVPVHQHVLALAYRLVPRPRRILDVGCGTGRLLRQARRQQPAAVLVGVDAAWTMVAGARAASPPDLAIRYLHASAERLPFAAESFDLVVATMTLRHWRDSAAGIAEIDRVLARAGALVVADSLPSSPEPRLPGVWWRRRKPSHKSAELANVVAGHGLVVVAYERMPWIALPDIHIVAARRPAQEP